SERIELLIDPETWFPMNEDMVSVDPIEWNLEETEEMDEGPVSVIEFQEGMAEGTGLVDPSEFNSEEEEESYQD
ncbi:hypothetical protein Dimus_001808, partial [Dionaea muscipula]